MTKRCIAVTLIRHLLFWTSSELQLRRIVEDRTLKAYDMAYACRFGLPRPKEPPEMTTITATEARRNLYRLIDEVSETHEPVEITGKRSNAVLVSEDDWRSIRETLFLLSIPGMRESIRAGMEEPIEECDETLDW